MPSGHRPDQDATDPEPTETQEAGGDVQKSRLGNYRLLDKLGEGATGSVFRAFDYRLDRAVAIRILPPSFARDGLAVQQFEQDVARVARLQHPNIAAVLDASTGGGVSFLVMELVDGRDLEDIVRQRGPLRVGEVIAFIIQAARGLEAAHQLGIVHHHLKPSKLKLDSAGTVRVLGLGLATMVDASNIETRDLDYLAPEQLDDPRQADHRADIFSLGCTLYFLMTGRSPFAGQTIPQRLTLHPEKPAASLCVARPDAPSSLEAAFQKMVAGRAEERPQSMTEVITLLEAYQSTAAAVEDAKGPLAPMDSLSFPNRHAVPTPSDREAPVLTRRDDVGESTGSDMNLDALLTDVHSEMDLPVPTLERAVKPRASRAKPPAPSSPEPPRLASRSTRFIVLSTLALASAVIVSLVLFAVRTMPEAAKPLESTQDSKVDGGDVPDGPKSVPSLPAPEPVVLTIFNGKSGKGWMLTNRKPLPPNRIQPDGLNPHGTGSYIVVYEKKLDDFVLDFDYKLSKGSSSGVFLRVGDLGDPVNTGIEVALNDTTGTSLVDSGAFYDLVAPDSNVQNPAGQWNHMTINAAGPVLAVSINGKDVSWINLDVWTVAGKRPDGTDHRFKKRPIAELPRSGYLGFQDHGRDCWFRKIILKTPRLP
jgi:serine/threonine protein kinase